MIGNGIDPQLMAKQASDTRDIVRFKQEMDGLKQRLSGNGEDREKELKKACQDFEAVFISQLWKGMKSTVPKEGYLHSKQEEQYMSMFDREFAENMSRAGGIGLADMIYEQLSQKLKETSRTTLTGKPEIKPLASEPIALNRGGEAVALPGKQEMTLEDWGGDSASESYSSQAVVSEMTSSMTAQTDSRPLSDVDVKARLEALARRLEAERIKEGLLGTSPAANKYESTTDGKGGVDVGRKLAEIG